MTVEFSLYASKQGHLIKNWKKRWFVCNTTTRNISYWESEEGAAASRGKKGVINVRNVVLLGTGAVKIFDVGGKAYSIKCEDHNSTVLFVSAFSQEFSKQVHAIPKDKLVELVPGEVDFGRVKLLENAIKGEDGNMNADLAKQFGLFHFLNRTASPLCAGQCVFINTTNTGSERLLGVIRQAVDGGFIVEAQDGRTLSVLSTDIELCTNLDATKASSQKDYLIDLSELVGLDIGNIPGQEQAWKDQAKHLLHASAVDLGHLPSMKHPVPALWTNWASFDGYVGHEMNTAAIETRVKGANGRLTVQEAGIMDMCTDMSKLLGQSMKRSTSI
jgi:hypothetical protein